MRALKISVAVLVVLLLVGDRVGAVVAARVIATRLQTAGSLSTRPDVSIRGYPFLTQAVSGRYGRIDLSAHDIRRRGVALASLDVQVTGARVDLRDALGGRVDSVPVEGLTALAVVSFRTIAARSKLRSIVVTPAGQQLIITGKLIIAGKSWSVQTASRVLLDGARLLISPESVHVEPAPTKAVLSAVLPLIQLRIEVGTLPYGLRLSAVKVAAEGVILSAKAGPTVLQQP